MPRLIYLDHNATSPPWPEVIEVVARTLQQGFANPASQHAAGRKARQALEDAREEIAARLGAPAKGPRPDRVVFTSGATEANNLAIFGLTGAVAGTPPGRIVTTAVEHPSVREAVQSLRTRGWRVDWAPVDETGRVDLDAFDALLAKPTSLASVIYASHETGVVQPIAELARIAAARGAPLHTDATQAAGKVALDFHSLGVAAMTVGSHKFQGPVGVGALVLRGEIDAAPLLFGGFQQASLRPGTESVSAVLGMLAALRIWDERRDALTSHLLDVRETLVERVRAARPEVLVNGEAAPRLPQVANLAFPGLDRQALLMALDLSGVCCSTGSACASGSSEPSPTLLAMKLPPEVIRSSLRFSVGPTTTREEAIEAAERIAACCERLSPRPVV
ncbi:MAG TPA: cysteine desulfurase family protein [Pirellulales bacterium]